MVRTDDIQIFATVAEQNGFSAASKLLEISPAVASASVKRLEHALGAQLFVRTTRSLQLTQAGEQYLTHAKVALEAISTGQHAVAQQQGKMSGNLSISVPSDLGRGFLRKAIDAFHSLHPTLNIRLLPSDHVSDLYKSPVDVAIRYGTPSNSSLYATPLVRDNHRVICASPEYFKQYGKPLTPEDLAHHRCLCFMLNDVVHNKWQFHQAENVQTVAVKGTKVSDDGGMVHQWALDGLGIAYKSRLDVIDDIKLGLLETALEDYGTEFVPLNMMTAQRMSTLPTANALHIFLTYAFTAHLKNANQQSLR